MNIQKIKKISSHTTFCSEASSGILFNNGVIRRKKTIRKKKTAKRLLYMQLEHDQKLMQEQHHLLQVFGLFITLSFKQRPVFLSSRLVPIAELENSFVSVSCER